MLLSEIKEHINNWFLFEDRVYSYRTNFYATHYITLKKIADNGFELVSSNSTIKEFPTLNVDELEKELMSNRLVFESNSRWHYNPFNQRNGGCDCGQWLCKGNTDLQFHSKWCELRK
jgi:hypothetical protein